jgi:hypothetical protein
MKPTKKLTRHKLIEDTYKVTSTSAWVLEIPHGDTLYEPFVRTNRPMNMEINTETIWGFGNDSFRYNDVRRWGDLYVEFYNTDMWDIINHWNGFGKKNLTLKKLDPTGMIIECWSLIGALLTEYRIINNNGVDIVSVNLNFDHAVLRH